MKISARKWIQLGGVLAVLAAIYIWNLPKRNPASPDSQSVKLENSQIKTEMIQSVEWKDQGSEMRFSIHSNDPSFCENWKTATVQLLADGMGVSGETPGARSTIPCEQGQFEMMWPKQMDRWQKPIEKTGDYLEVPRQFYVRSISIEGPAGQMKITNYEISAIRSESFQLTLQ